MRWAVLTGRKLAFSCGLRIPVCSPSLIVVPANVSTGCIYAKEEPKYVMVGLVKYWNDFFFYSWDFCLGLLPPIEPFHIRNRFETAAVFGILAFELLKIFEELLFGLVHTSKHGALVELFLRMGTVVLVGYVLFWKWQNHYFFLL